MKYLLELILVAGLLFVPVSRGAADEQAPQPREDPAPSGKEETKQPLTPKQANKEKLSKTEQILSLESVLAKDRKDLEAIKKKLADPKSDYVKAEAAFKDLDAQWRKKKLEIDKLRKAGKKDEAAELEADAAPLQKRWQLANERFNLALNERKVLHELEHTLTLKNQQTQATLNQLEGVPERSKETETSAEKTPDQPAPATKQPPKPALPSLPGVPAIPKTAAPASTASKPSSSKEINQTEKEIEQKEKEAKQAEEEVHWIEERKRFLHQTIDLEQQYLKAQQKKAEIASVLVLNVNKELQDKLAKKAAGADLEKLKKDIAAAEQNQSALQKAVKAGMARLTDLQTELKNVEADEIAAVQAAAQKRHDVEEAKQRLAEVANPFTLANILSWLLHHGPKILIIILGTVVLQYLVKFFSQRIADLMSRHHFRGTLRERKNRADTLVGVFRNTASVFILTGGVLMFLQEVGIPIVPLMGGAAVLGLAVAFGAQNLIKDYFSGFMVLLEDQYGVNDVVKIAGVAGLVERISLRMTVLRDQDGTVYFVPHGSITTVSNMTHGWSRALFNISISYKEDVDQVMQVLIQLGKELRQDPAFRDMILDDPEMMGVDQLGEYALIIQFFIKTVPLQQWNVKREMQRRIYKRFSELKIEMPFPTRTLYHRYENEDGRSGEDEAAHSTGDVYPERFARRAH